MSEEKINPFKGLRSVVVVLGIVIIFALFLPYLKPVLNACLYERDKTFYTRKKPTRSHVEVPSHNEENSYEKAMRNLYDLALNDIGKRIESSNCVKVGYNEFFSTSYGYVKFISPDKILYSNKTWNADNTLSQHKNYLQAAKEGAKMINAEEYCRKSSFLTREARKKAQILASSLGFTL